MQNNAKMPDLLLTRLCILGACFQQGFIGVGMFHSNGIMLLVANITIMLCKCIQYEGVYSFYELFWFLRFQFEKFDSPPFFRQNVRYYFYR